MSKLLLTITSLLLLFSCKEKSKPDIITHFGTRDYVKVGQMFDTIKPPYVIDVQNGNKRIVFIGCEHQADTNHAQFKAIEDYFDVLKPQIAFHEGGQLPDSVHYATRNSGILKNGETGILKYLSDKAGIKMMDGDMKDAWEMSPNPQSDPENINLGEVEENGTIGAIITDLDPIDFVIKRGQKMLFRVILNEKDTVWAIFKGGFPKSTFTEDWEIFFTDVENNQQNRRGFTQFKAFNRFLIKAYQERAKGQTVADLYPQIIKWFGENNK